MYSQWKASEQENPRLRRRARNLSFGSDSQHALSAASITPLDICQSRKLDGNWKLNAEERAINRGLILEAKQLLGVDI